MEIISGLLSHNEITYEWEKSEMNSAAAKLLTIRQAEAFEKIIIEDESWKLLLSVFNNGRDIDAWLAMDWPDGFDELLLCVPLCKFVAFECSKCTVGSRQENNSCAHDFSLFGYIAELLKTSDREGLKKHLNYIIEMLTNEKLKWDVNSHCPVN